MNWYKNSTSSGYSPGDFLRFEVLAALDFDSILDVGSGPCELLTWLAKQNRSVEYEAVDIRADALEHCKCKTHEKLPARKKYDLVVLFGVADYCTPQTLLEKKKEFEAFLLQASKRARNKIVFSVVKDEYKSPRLVTYSLAEAAKLAELISTNYTVYESVEPTEYIVEVDIK